jgi:hypothetical protein
MDQAAVLVAEQQRKALAHLTLELVTRQTHRHRKVIMAEMYLMAEIMAQVAAAVLALLVGMELLQLAEMAVQEAHLQFLAAA